MKKILFAALMLVSFSASDCQAQGFGKFMKSAVKGLGKVITSTPSSSATSSDAGSSSEAASSRTSFSSQSMGEQTLKISRLHPDLDIKVSRCEAVENTLYLSVTMLLAGDEDVNVLIQTYRDGTKCIDDTGKELNTNQYIKVMSSGDREYGSGTDFTLVTGVKKKVDFKITGISKAAEAIARFDSYINIDALGINGYITLKNVPISREE